MKFAVGCSDWMMSAYKEFSCLEWLIPAGELFVASSLDKACLAQGSPWGFKSASCHFVPRCDRNQCQSKAGRCVSPCLCGWGQLKDSEMAHKISIPCPGTGPGSHPAVLLSGCSSCSAAGPEGQHWLSRLQGGQSSFPTGRRVPAPR